MTIETITAQPGGYTKQVYRLSTGREVDANLLIIGLSPRDPDRNHWVVHEGFDGEVFTDYPDEVWTPAERAELADYMIALWTQYKAEALARND